MSQSSPKRKHRIRCAVYTRKSTEEGLYREFNSLDAQREAAENYIASQKQEGWQCLPDRYDDGGYTGGNIQRPALQQLLNDVQSDKIGCVVVYKVDRLSRSLLDFARLMEVFERHEVSFVSVTQQFNTASSMGRLMLNVLLSFAQFEREIISERTRDKMGAARRKGKRLGGRPVLGYGVDPQTGRLVIEPEEAERVRAIFALYQEQGGLIPTVRELAGRGWVSKRWTTHTGTVLGGLPLNKARLHYLLTNVTYVGQVKYQGRLYPGEQEAIVPQDLFDAVQRQLSENGGKRKPRPRAGTLPGILEGLLYCGACDVRMGHTYTSKGSRRYRYYVCPRARERGSATCPAGSVPAAELEGFVWSQLAEDPAVCLDGDRSELTTAEQAARLAEVVERIDYDGREGELAIRLAPRNCEEST